MPETTTLPSRIAALSDDTTTIHGVAIAAGDVTRGLEGTRKVWPADALQAAAQSLSGVPITVLHSEQAAGEVVRAAYDDERDAVVYEAELTDEKLAAQVRQGQADVSIEARHRDGGRDVERGAMLATDIQFTGLSIVQHGAAPSNTAEVGPAPAQSLAARLSASQICDTLDTSLASIAGISYSGTKGGKLDESAIPSDDFESHYVFDGDTKSDSQFPLVDGSGNLRAGNVSAAFDLRGHAPDEAKLLRVLAKANNAFDDPPIDPENLKEARAATPADDPPEADDGMAPEDSGPTDAETPPSKEAPMTEEESDTTDEAPDAEALLSRIDEQEEHIGELESKLEAQNEEINAVKEAYASTLAAHADALDEDDFVEKFEVAELREKFEALDAELAEPSEPEPDVQSGAGDGEETADLGADGEELIAELGCADRTEAVELLETRYEKYTSAGWESNAQTVADQLATLGVEVDE